MACYLAAVRRVVTVAVLMAGMLVTEGQCYFFSAGHSHHYTYTSVNTMLERHNVTTVIKFHINFLGEGVTGERIHSLHVNSVVQHSENGQLEVNPQKWNLTKSFVFVSNASGVITLVHVHPEDHDELVVLKKAVASIFSVHVQIDENKDDWHYDTEETDHLGRLRHTYHGQRRDKWLILNRKHESEDKVRRTHEKTMHYDSLGTLRMAVAYDHVLLDRRAENTNPKPGPEDPQVQTSGDYPGIEAAAHVTVKFAGKKWLPADNFQEQRDYVTKLNIDTLETLHNAPKEKKFGLEALQANITEVWKCIHFHTGEGNDNRTACVHDLGKLLSRLKPEHYKRYATEMLAKNCSREGSSSSGSNSVESLCRTERWIMLDVVASRGDVISQRLLVTYVLSRAKPRLEEEGEGDNEEDKAEGEDLRRVFIHCATLERPTMDFVRAVETFCFGADGDQYAETGRGSDRVSRTQSRACLAVGSLAKHLFSSGLHREADRLAARLEAWLDHHGQGDSPSYGRDTSEAYRNDVNVNFRIKESTTTSALPDDDASNDDDDDDDDDRRHMAKAVLLHSLGNGGLSRSRDHLLRHAQPDTGHHISRRAAFRALGQFSCEQSGRALLAGLTKDSMVSVRRAAWNSLVTHPYKQQLLREQEDDILSADYTYASVSRVKRSLTDILDKVLFDFKLATPSYEWNKDIGISAIGGKLSAKVQNSVEGMFRVLSGHVDVDVHDKLYASAHLLGDKYQIVILHAEVCYRGRLTYNLNIMKDFTVGFFSDVSSLFNHIIRRLMAPVEKVASRFIVDYKDPSTGQPKSAFQPLADAVKKLPEVSRGALKATKDLGEAADLLGVLPVVKKLQDRVSQAKVFLEDIHSEAVELFGNINEETRVALPFAEKEIKGAVNSVLKVLNKVKDYPKQAFSVMETAKRRYMISMMIISEARKTMKQAFSFLTGGRSAWNNGRAELKNLRDQIEDLVKKIRTLRERRKRPQASTTFNPSAAAQQDKALQTVVKKSNDMLNEVDSVLNKSPKQLQNTLVVVNAQIDVLKTAFSEFKNGIDIIKTRLQAMFGTKFHPSFPAIRRDCDEKCGCGVYPTDCKRYGHPGVDLVLNKGWKVPNPASGMVYMEASNTTLRIEPKTDDLKAYKIYISNVQVNHPDLLKKRKVFVEAGKTLGVSLGNSSCIKGHIHVAMRRTSPDTGLCHYIDPTIFLNHTQPLVRWQQECNDFVFKHAFQTLDFSTITKGFKPFIKQLKRDALDYLKGELKELIPDDSPLKPLRDVGFNFLDTGKLDMQPLEDVFDKGIDTAKKFLKKIKTGDFSLEGLLNEAKGKAREFLGPVINGTVGAVAKGLKLPKSLKGIDSLSIGSLTRLWDKINAEDLLKFPDFELGDLSSIGDLGDLGEALIRKVRGFLDNKTLGGLGDLRNFLDRFSGGRGNLISRLKEAIREKACPAIGKFLKNQGFPCVPHDDCWGLSCVVTLRKQALTGKINIDVKVDKNNVTAGKGGRAVRLFVDGEELTASFDAQDEIIPTNIKVFGDYDVKLRMTSVWKNDELQFSLKLQACDSSLRCLPDTTLARNISFSNVTVSSLLSGINLQDKASNITLKPLDYSHRLTADLDVDDPELAKTILAVEDLVRDKLKGIIPDDAILSYYEEFPNPRQYKDDGSYPVSGQGMEIYKPFFKFSYPIPLGIATIRIRVSAGGAFGLAFDFKVESTEMGMKTSVGPWVSGKVEVGMSISIFVFSAGIDLHGWFLKCKFPLILHSDYTKTPMVLTKQIDLIIIPLELKLVVWFEIRLQIKIWKFKIKLFRKRWSKTVWHYRTPAISFTIWKKTDRKDDLEPPRFAYCTEVDQQCKAARKRGRRSTPGQAMCSVRQLTGRHHKDPAFSLDFSAVEDISDLALSYAVGDYPGGTNVQAWTPMRGQMLTVSVGNGGDVLPCGRPLYFLARARNSQGLEAEAQCSLPTLDCTLPGGRVDMASPSTSHWEKLSASVVVYEDSELKTDRLFYAVGFGPGPRGNEVVEWTPLQMKKGSTAQGGGVVAAGYLSRFTPPRQGRLTLPPFRVLTARTAEDCARKCFAEERCTSFSYSPVSDVCELQKESEGSGSQRRVKDGQFATYEQLDEGQSARLHLSLPLHRLPSAGGGLLASQRRPLRHGVTYYVNAHVENVLGFRSVLTSKGVTVDHSSPEPGYLGEGWREVEMDEAKPGHPGRCNVSVIQRCVDPAPVLKHRKFIDGKGSTAVLNGDLRGRDMKYTKTTTRVSANWNGFVDGESGIHGFTMAVGTTVCGTDVIDFTSPVGWENAGSIHDLHLTDGPYYVTVQAASDTELGGDLVTTVCHSTPFLVDTRPPVVHGVDDIVFDDSFRLLAVYFNVSDAMSGVASVEFGLGKTRHDVDVRSYHPFEIRGKPGNEYFLVEEFQGGSGGTGQSVWVRLKAVDNVGLVATGTGNVPILVDSSAPLAGTVLDGDTYGVDTCCTSDADILCAQWSHFEDPESHIDSYMWGVGRRPGKDDVVPFNRVSRYDGQACATKLTLAHNVTYFSTVVAFNTALNQKSVNASSDGVLVDLTPPVAGRVVNGDAIEDDVDFTSETASLSAAWANFSDPETGITSYTVSVFVNDVLDRAASDVPGERFSDHSMVLNHGDKARVMVKAFNGAGSDVTVTSDGMTVDHTPPELVRIGTAAAAAANISSSVSSSPASSSSSSSSSFQTSDTSLSFAWEFRDPESGVAEFRASVFQQLGGGESLFWPTPGQQQHAIIPNSNPGFGAAPGVLELQGLSLTNGASYVVQVIAVNRAKMAATARSPPVTIDTTAPMVEEVRIASPGSEEEVNDDGEVEHVEGEPLYVSWKARDFESGLASVSLSPHHEPSRAELFSSDFSELQAEQPEMLGRPHQRLSGADDVKLKR